ncbi:MAG: OmpA family protein [Bacteroidia bacterium]
MMQKNFYLLIFLFLINLAAKAQDEEKKTSCPEIENKKARELFEKSRDKKKYKMPERIEMLRKVLEMEPDYAEANFALAQEFVVKCKVDNQAFTPAIPYFKKAVQVCPQIHSEPYYYIGFNFYEEMQNDSAIVWLKKFINFKDDDEKKFAKDYEAEMYQAKEMVKYAKKENSLKDKKPVPFNPVVVQGISTKNSEYLPYLSPDQTEFLFTRSVPNQSMDQVYASDKEKELFMHAIRKKDGTWPEGEPMDWPFNEAQNEGGATLTIDNKHLYYTQSRSEGGNQPNTDIYYSDNIDDAWSKIQKMPNINDPVYWDSQPTVSADGNTIIFASDRKGGYGGIDLYMTHKDPKTRSWGKPVNMGPKINTSGHEKCPFLHSDSETLYYSSDGFFGYGKMDIYYTRKDSTGEWKTPENIGSPINGEGDDAGFLVSTDGKLGFFCSWPEGKVSGKGIGKYDIYQFDLYPEARPGDVTFMKGQLKDKDGDPIRNAVVEIKNVKTKEKTLAVVDSISGEYTVAVNLKRKDDIIITAKADGHAFSSQIVKVKGATFEKPVEPVNLEVNKAEKGSSFVINNIYYATGSADLYPESFIVLDEFAEFLKEHPSMIVEIQGHTDNVGSEASNLALSSDRAQTVKAYLEAKGDNPHQIKFKGYGSSKPIADNKTVEGKAKNRRTEFLIIEN